MPDPQILVRAPGVKIEFGDVGLPFHAASVGKLATAVLVTMLIEEGRANFHTPIGALVPSTDIVGLPAAVGVDVARDVTLDHLLSHTSGLPDYFDPPGRMQTACSRTAVVADPDRRWTPTALLDEVRRLRSVGRPGARFHYSDTGYILLGRIVEEAFGQSFANCLRTRIFEPTGMMRTSTPYDATLIPDDLAELDVAPAWLGKHELSRTHCLSLDWAGGGLVSTVEDLVRFQRALHAGGLIAPENVRRMEQPRHRFHRGIHYGAGSMTLKFGEFFPLLRGLPHPTGHLGVTGTHLFYYPQHKAHVVLNYHATQQMRHSFQAHIVIAQMLADLRHHIQSSM